MAEFYKTLASADLLVFEPPPMLMTPLSAMRSAEEVGLGAVVYTVPDGFQAIIKMIICTSDMNQQSITMRTYSDGKPAPLFGPISLGEREWAEWSGSLTLSSGAQILGTTSAGSASVGIYGMERSP